MCRGASSSSCCSSSTSATCGCSLARCELGLVPLPLQPGARLVCVSGACGGFGCVHVRCGVRHVTARCAAAPPDCVSGCSCCNFCCCSCNACCYVFPAKTSAHCCICQLTCVVCSCRQCSPSAAALVPAFTRGARPQSRACSVFHAAWVIVAAGARSLRAPKKQIVRFWLPAGGLSSAAFFARSRPAFKKSSTVCRWQRCWCWRDMVARLCWLAWRAESATEG